VPEPETDAERTVVLAPLPPVHEAWLPTEHPLYRPRHSSRQRTALVCALIFFCAPVLALGLGVRPAEFENHRLASFPSVASGWGFFTGLPQWATDHLPFRESAVSAADGISRGVFREPPRLGEQPPPQSPVAGPIAPSPSERDRDELRAAGFPKVIEGAEGWLYLGYDVLGACLPERQLDDVIASLERLRAVVEDSGRQFVFVVAPDKTTMVPQYLPGRYVGSECAKQAREEFWRRAVGTAGAVDLRPALELAAVRRGAPVYGRADTHWTYEGGLAMTRAVAEAVRPGVTAAWRATPAAVVKRPADLLLLTGRRVEYPLQTYDLATDGTTIRSRPVPGDFRTPTKLSQPAGKGVVAAKAGMIADSFTLFAAPYLAGGFGELTLLHVDAVGADPRAAAAMLAESEVVVFQAVERSLIGGINPMLSPQAISIIGAELAKRPVG